MKVMKNIIRRFVCAFAYLTASDSGLERLCFDRQMKISAELMIISLVWGGILAWLWDAVFHITWTVFGILNWVIPAVVCAAAIGAGLYRQGLIGLVRTLTGDRLIFKLLGAGAVIFALSAVLNYSFHLSNPDWATQLPVHLRWLWPRPICRMLIVAPVWGTWAMMVLGQFHRPDEQTDLPTEKFIESVKPIAAAGYLVLPFAMTLVFLKYLPVWREYIPPVAAATAAFGGGTLIKKRLGSVNRQVLLATNFLTQLALLAGYLLVR